MLFWLVSAWTYTTGHSFENTHTPSEMKGPSGEGERSGTTPPPTYFLVLFPQLLKTIFPLPVIATTKSYSLQP